MEDFLDFGAKRLFTMPPISRPRKAMPIGWHTSCLRPLSMSPTGYLERRYVMIQVKGGKFMALPELR